MTDLIKLAEQCETDAGSRELDYAIHCRNGLEGVGAYGPHPHYTTSLDAALTLVPEGCDRADHVWPDTEGGFCTYLWAGKPHQIVGKSRAATPALALCAAALRARAGKV